MQISGEYLSMSLRSQKDDQIIIFLEHTDTLSSKN